MATLLGTMRKTGELVQWNNKSGYGFVRDEAGRDYYVHVSKMLNGARPRLGDRLSFEVAQGRKGRPSAIEIALDTPPPPPPLPPQTLRAAIGPVIETEADRTLGLRTAAATMMTMLILLAISWGHAGLGVGLLYTLMGAGSALLYRFDKLYALQGRWRVSETNLHTVDLAFGIIGGLLAQEFYRHKTIKPRFVATTWGIALLHTLLLAAVALGWFAPFLPVIG
jgi:uncharacterized membrane protein YsdA (DUF1294 family)/cold shock CspA family protein